MYTEKIITFTKYFKMAAKRGFPFLWTTLYYTTRCFSTLKMQRALAISKHLNMNPVSYCQYEILPAKLVPAETFQANRIFDHAASWSGWWISVPMGVSISRSTFIHKMFKMVSQVQFAVNVARPLLHVSSWLYQRLVSTGQIQDCLYPGCWTLAAEKKEKEIIAIHQPPHA